MWLKAILNMCWNNHKPTKDEWLNELIQCTIAMQFWLKRLTFVYIIIIICLFDEFHILKMKRVDKMRRPKPNKHRPNMIRIFVIVCCDKLLENTSSQWLQVKMCLIMISIVSKCKMLSTENWAQECSCTWSHCETQPFMHSVNVCVC